MTQYTFPGEQWDRLLKSSAATRTMEGVDQGILTEDCDTAILRKIKYNYGLLNMPFGL